MAKDKNRIGKHGDAEKWDKGVNQSGMEALKEGARRLAEQAMSGRGAAAKQAPKRPDYQNDPTQRSVDASFGFREGAGPSASGYEEAPRMSKLKDSLAASAAQAAMPVSEDLASSLAQANKTPEQLQEEEAQKRTAALKAALLRVQQGQQ